MFACNDKGGDRRDAHLAAVRVAVDDLLLIGVGVQQTADHGSVQFDPVGNIGQRVGVANVAAFDEIGLEQGRHGSGLAAFDAYQWISRWAFRVLGVRFIASKSIFSPAFCACSTTGA